MSLILDAACLDRWLADFDEFRSDFLFFAVNACKAMGYELDFDLKQLATAHAGWKADHQLWHDHKVSASPALSHFKIIAILLVNLCKAPWIRALYEYSGEDVIYNGSVKDRSESRKDLNSGREVFLALNFALQVLNWFEVRRTDKNDPFIYRMTPDLEQDMTVYLLSPDRTAMATFIILKALYARGLTAVPSEPHAFYRAGSSPRLTAFLSVLLSTPTMARTSTGSS